MGMSVTFVPMAGYEEKNGPLPLGGVIPWLSVVAAMAAQFSFAYVRLADVPDSPLLAQAVDASRMLGLRNANTSVLIDVPNQAGQLIVPATHGSGRLFSWLATDGISVELSLVLVATAIPLIAGISTCLATSSVIAGVLAPWIAGLIWWLKPNCSQWFHGNVEVTLLGPTFGYYLASLIRHHKNPGIWSWIGLAVSSAIGWLLFPIPWLVFFVPATIAWLFVAHRHEILWHGWLVLAVMAGAAPFINSWVELSRQWSVLGGLAPNVVGSAWPMFHGDRPTVFALATIQVGLALLPCVARTSHAAGNVWGIAGIVIVSVATISHTSQTSVSEMLDAMWRMPASLATVGANADLSNLSIDHTARLLCDGNGDELIQLPPTSLLQLRPRVPLLFGTSNTQELPSWSMGNGGLGGRPMFDWSDEELNRIMERWNIGWVWALHTDCIQRLERLPGARPLTAHLNGVLFRLERRHRFILKGQGQWSVQSNGDVVLTDIVPDEGEVVLSLRYYRAWTVTPSHIVIEPEIDPYDPLPIVRLRLNGPTSRVVLHVGR